MPKIPQRGAGGRFVKSSPGLNHQTRTRANRHGRKKNAAELVIFNPRKRAARPPSRRSKTGSKRNAAELVIFNPKRRVKLTPAQQSRWENYFAFYVQDEGKSDAAADRLAWRDLVKEFPELKKARGAKNPKRRLNPDEMQEAIQLYEQFHGESPSEILKIQEAAEIRSTYTGLGDLIELLVKAPSGRKVQMSYSERDEVMVASNAKGTQIYLIGGNQNISASLGEFGADTTKDFIELGECEAIVYFTRKEFDGFKPYEYKHKFGEDGGARPVLVYNKIQKRLILVGGSYTVEAPGIIN